MRFLRGLTAMVIVAVAANVATLADAHEHKQGPLTVVHPWSRATAPSQKAGSVYLRIENTSDQPDRLVGVESELADVTSLHTIIRDGDVIKMRPVKGGIAVPANGHVLLAPGGVHVMLIGLREQLIKETTIPLILVFERAGRIEIEAVVDSAGARGPRTADADGGQDHGQHGAGQRSKK